MSEYKDFKRIIDFHDLDREAKRYDEMVKMKACKILDRDQIYELVSANSKLTRELAQAHEDAASYKSLWEDASATLRGRQELEQKIQRHWWRRIFK